MTIILIQIVSRSFEQIVMHLRKVNEILNGPSGEAEPATPAATTGTPATPAAPEPTLDQAQLLNMLSGGYWGRGQGHFLAENSTPVFFLANSPLFAKSKFDLKIFIMAIFGEFHFHFGEFAIVINRHWLQI